MQWEALRANSRVCVLVLEQTSTQNFIFAAQISRLGKAWSCGCWFDSLPESRGGTRGLVCFRCCVSNPVLNSSPTPPPPTAPPEAHTGSQNGALERTIRWSWDSCPVVETGLGGETSMLDWDGGPIVSCGVERFGLLEARKGQGVAEPGPALD